jgi:hypothetical protein
MNPQTGKFDIKSVFEVEERGPELEAKGKITNLRRPDNPKVDLDFVAEYVDSGETIYIDHKRMIDFKTLLDQGRQISHFPSHETVAFNMGKDSIKQKRNFHTGTFRNCIFIKSNLRVSIFSESEFIQTKFNNSDLDLIRS